MNKITSLQKKLNETNSNHRKLDILHKNLQEKYSRLARLLERVKSHNFDSLLKISKEHTNYANMMSNRRIVGSKQGRRTYKTKKMKIVSKKNSRMQVSHSFVTETDENDSSDDSRIEVIHDDLDSLDLYSFLNKTLAFKVPPKRWFSHKDLYYDKLNCFAETSLIKTSIDSNVEIKPKNDAIIQTDDVELYKICNNNYMYTFSQNTRFYPSERRLMDNLQSQSKSGSRQNKIISLLLNNPEYNLRVQNMFHSDTLNSLIDTEYFMPIYYNSLYQKIDKLLSNLHDNSGFNTPKSYIQNTENDDSFSDDDDFDSSNDEEDTGITSGKFKMKNLTKTVMKSIQKLKKNPMNLKKIPTNSNLKRSGSRGSLTVGPSKFKKDKNQNKSKLDEQEEERFYQEQKALLDEEVDGFEEEEFETELPRRISEAVKVLNDRMKELKKDEFGDPIIEEGFLEEPTGKNLQLSALRLTNLMSQLFKKNPLPEFKKQIEAMYKNFKLGSAIENNNDIKSKLMTGKGLSGILGMLQKNNQKLNPKGSTLDKSNSDSTTSLPTGFNPNRRQSSIYSADKLFKPKQPEAITKSNILTTEEIIKIHEQMKEGKFDYYICTNCYLKSKSKTSQETQTDSTSTLDDSQDHNDNNLKPENNRQNSIAIISSSGKDITLNHMPTQNPYANSNIAGPNLGKRTSLKPNSVNIQKVKTTKHQAFNFSHQASTINFGNYELFTPSARSQMDFRLFNLSKSGFSSSAKGFKLPNYIFIFVQKFREGHKSVKQVNPLPMKMMIKQMNQLYVDKANQAKDSVNIRNATMLEFLYEFLQNKYGKTPILERKVKEILVTTLRNEEKFKNINLFAKFLGISESSSYTNDDLSMYYCINRLIGYNSLDQIKLFFSGKMSQQTLGSLLSELLDLANPDHKRINSISQNNTEQSIAMLEREDIFSI